MRYEGATLVMAPGSYFSEGSASVATSPPTRRKRMGPSSPTPGGSVQVA